MTETPNPHIVDADTMTGEMRPIRRAVLSMGSNLGERLANLQGGLSALVDTPEVTVVDVSPCTSRSRSTRRTAHATS